jgi:hypothetical protein
MPSSSQFWQERATLFQQIPGCDVLHADGHYIIGSGEPWIWQLKGGATEFTREKFENLARQSAFEIAPTGTTDLLVAWLEAIRKEYINFHSEHLAATEINDDGSKRELEYMVGIIDRVCEASAILCRRLANRALQDEFEEKQRNDPKNWSQFRQQYEALKSIKEVRSEPAERISEEFARNTIARIRGIKPEEVTMEQIRFEISGLLPFYHHIELIPSAPKSESPPIPDTKPTDQAETIELTNRERIDRFILKMAQAGTKVKRKDIWLVAGYKDPTEFERFQRGDNRNQSAASTFNRVLGMAPQDFLRLLQQKRG